MPIVARSSKLGFSLLVGFSAVTLQLAPVQANEAPLSTSTPEMNSDPFSTRGDNSGSVMQLIHRVMRGEATGDRREEAEAQRESLNDAAASFFEKRNARLKEKQAGQPTNSPSSAPGASNLTPTSATPTSATPTSATQTSTVDSIVPGSLSTQSADLLITPAPAAQPAAQP